MTRIGLLAGFLVLWTCVLYGEEGGEIKSGVRDLGGGWFEARGEAHIVNITPEDARDRARQEAYAAVVSYAGFGLQTQELRLKSRVTEKLQGAYISLFDKVSAGRIVEIGPERWESYELPGEPFPIRACRVWVRVKIAKERGQPDPDFDIELSINKKYFVDGEEMRLAITSTIPCYISVLNLTMSDTVVVLLPHRYRQEHFIDAGDTLRLPNASEKSLGVRYRVDVPVGMSSATGVIKVVATKQAHIYGRARSEVRKAGQLPTKQSTLMELMRWMVQIPRDQRAEAQVLYEVHK